MKSMKHMTYRSRCGQYTVAVGLKAFKSISRIAQDHAPNEIGTSLVGHYSEDGKIAYIDDLAPIAPDSEGSPVGFCRGVEGAKEFYNSLPDGLFYVGEWHSHPHRLADASDLEWESTKAIAEDEKVSISESILLILGESLTETCEMQCYLYSAKNGRIMFDSMNRKESVLEIQAGQKKEANE